MSKKTHLDPELLAHLDNLFAEALLAGVDPGRAALAAHVGPRIVAAAESGSDAENGILAGLARDGLEERAYVFLKSETGLLALPSGSAVKSAVRVAVRKRTADGRRSPSQLRIWWDLTWEEYGEWRDAMQAMEARLADKRHAFAKVDHLLAEYPDTRTPGEACERAGIDPRAFGLEEAA